MKDWMKEALFLIGVFLFFTAFLFVLSMNPIG